MPYDVEKRGGKWVVVSPNGVKGTHGTKEQAQAQQRAIYANTGEEARKRRKIRKKQGEHYGQREKV